MRPSTKRRLLRSTFFLLILLSTELALSLTVRADQASTVGNTITVQGDGTATWAAIFAPGGPDYVANKEAYESLGQGGYADAWSATLKAACAWNIQQNTLRVTFAADNSMLVSFNIANFAAKVDQSKFNVGLICLRDAGFRFEGSSADGRSYDFIASQFCDLLACSGPYLLRITLPSPISNVYFDQTGFQIHFETSVPVMPGAPLESAIIFIILIIAGTTILVVTLLFLSKRGLLAPRHW